MAVAAKIHAVENGRDIRRYTLLAFGGAGPIHAREVARRSGCSDLLVPANAGVFSAFGLLVAPMKMDMVRTRYARLSEMDWGSTEALLQGMEDALCQELASAGVTRDLITFRRSADMRYVGQGFEVETELPAQLLQTEQASIEASFAQAYAARFGGKLIGQRVEAVNWRVEASANAALSAQVRSSQAPAGQSAKAERSRQVFFPDIEGFIQTPVLSLEQLRAEQRYEGPALVEQPGSTVVIGPGDVFTLDAHGNLRITLGARQGRAA